MCKIWDINLSVLKASSANSDSPELFRLVFDLQEDAKGSSSDDIGLGLCPIPEGCCRPADCSSVLKTAMIARIVASSTWDHGFEGALIRRRNKLCHFCLNCKRRVAACLKKNKFYFCTHTFEAFSKLNNSDTNNCINWTFYISNTINWTEWQIQDLWYES